VGQRSSKRPNEPLEVLSSITCKIQMVGRKPELNRLNAFLREADKTQHWCGLQMVVTKDGNILWLCAEHGRFHGI
jgi:hypothetical protein